MTPFPTAPLKRRFAALVYELLLVSAVTAVTAIVAGISAIALNPVSTYLSGLVTALLMQAGWWYYFRSNWLKKGQTLAMQTWKIGLCNQQGVQPPLPQLRSRFLWASVFIVFIPLLAYAALRQQFGIPPMPAFAASLFWLILPWGFAWLNPDRQFLYDFLAGTRLVDLKAE
ncbi:RDD family protein [Neisseria sp. ZJ106]|uniref:RDD family protein n=1 Tax=Neisseria lisongii TaxID=2912188 RepID=A0ABY7RHS2_9NEIS|nr:RDD family protein [Neisseria lisongii]MCF7521637.1 RDD family protein [Neisseria lisongii]WCL70872.1 RDD family protein [Neisseria lisongii]